MGGGFLYQDGGAAVKGVKKGGVNTPLFLFTANEADFWCGISLVCISPLSRCFRGVRRTFEFKGAVKVACVYFNLDRPFKFKFRLAQT